ncbi:MAG TPA: serine/threonine-protein kinase [Polyangiaceae bacterium]|nr:serine/threonine-protein kinase [Polyangiaceae bacterium]
MTNRAIEPSWTIPTPGDTLAGKYVVEGLCGRGGLAVVLSAMHAGLGQRVAVKMLLPEWAGDQDVVQRFVREGRAATRIRSEHVVRVFDVGTLENGAPYLVLEYLDGHDLDEVVSMWGPLPVATAIDWVLQAVEAIAEAHAYGIVHRDLKPANLFLTQRADGSACIKVLDFGLSKLTDPRMSGASAKLTRPTDVMGSLHYMAPEQLRASCEADTRADLWALGAVLHELLTTQPPFRGETMPELCATVLTQPPPRLSSLRENVAPEIERAVLRCLEKDPSARFATAAELARALSPFGTDVARRSCARIERVLETGGRASELTPLPSQPIESFDWQGAWPSEVPFRRPSATSPKMILGSLLILGGIGAGAFLWMYSSVHGDEARTPPAEAVAPRAAAFTTPAIPDPPLTAAQTAAPAATAAATPPAPSPPPARLTSPPSPPRAPAPARPPQRPARNAVLAATATAVVAHAPTVEAQPSTSPFSRPNDEAPTDDVFEGRK